MPIIAAKCPNCSGDIQLDDTKKSGFCMYCGSQVLVQDAIDLARVRIDGAVAVEGVATLEKLVQNGAKFLELGEFKRAKEVYARITDGYPEDYRGWWGVVCAKTSNFLIGEVSPSVRPADRELRNALKLAPEQLRASMRRQYDAWLDKGWALNERRIVPELIGRANQDIARLQNDIQDKSAVCRKHRNSIVRWLVVGAAAVVVILCCTFIFSPWSLLLFVPWGYIYAGAFSEHKDLKDEMKSIQDTRNSLSEAQKELTNYQQRMADAERRLA